MNTITFTHQKGGTGKTTACINVAGWLAKLGNRVLVIDLDPQGNATAGLGINQETVKVSVLDALVGRVDIKKSILKTQSDTHLLPATASLLKGERYLAAQQFPVTVLKKKLQSIRPYYDYVCIDTPPASMLLILNGVAAAENIIIPLDTSAFALEAMETFRVLLQTIDCMRSAPIAIRQILLLEYPLSSFSFFQKNPTEEIKEALKEFLETHCDEAPPIMNIPYSRQVYGAQKCGLSLSHYAPSSKAGSAYKKIAERIINETIKQ